MNSLFSAVSGQFSRYLIFGSMLPVILFEFLTAVFTFPLLPTGLLMLASFHKLDKEWIAVIVAVVTLVLTGLLYNVNIPLIRWYEGYPWERSWIGKWRKQQHRTRRARLSVLRAQLRDVRDTLRKYPDTESLTAELEDTRTRVAQEVAGEYPAADLVLPTRLGNVIRNFEDYSRQQYGLDAIFLWSRIVGVTPKEYLSAVDDAKTSFDFFLNCSFVSTIETALLLACGLAFKKPFASDQQMTLWLGQILFAAGLAYFSYRGAIDRASSWGAQVKGVFDLYRGALLRQLGYMQRPTSRDAERLLWREISKQVYYGDPPFRAPAAYESRFTVVPKPPDIGLAVTSGMKTSANDSAVEFLCHIRNTDERKRSADEVEATVWPPCGFEYVWESATIMEDSVSRALESSRDYNFGVGALGHGKSILLSCRFAPVPEYHPVDDAGEKIDSRQEGTQP
jgi:hypothetical protein